MAWTHDVPEDRLYAHEGVPVAILGDGTEPEAIRVRLTTGAGTSPNSSWYLYDGSEGRPLAAVVRAACECGWRGERVHPIDWDDHEATEGWETQSGPYADWAGHIDQLRGATLPTELADAVELLATRLGALADTRPRAVLVAAGRLAHIATSTSFRAATEARAGGLSWEDIGDALGISKQAAHQRFARHIASLGSPQPAECVAELVDGTYVGCGTCVRCLDQADTEDEYEDA